MCDGGDKDLQEILDEQGSKPLPENQCRYIFECMVAAVRHMHSLDYVSNATPQSCMVAAIVLSCLYTAACAAAYAYAHMQA